MLRNKEKGLISECEKGIVNLREFYMNALADGMYTDPQEVRDIALIIHQLQKMIDGPMRYRYTVIS